MSNQTNRYQIRTPASLVGLLLALASLCLAPSGQAALLFHDAFAYTASETLGTGSSTVDWENPKSNITIANGSLSYTGLESSTGNRVNVNGGSSNLDGVRTTSAAWASQSNGTLYISFLLRVDSTSAITATGNGIPILNISQAGQTSKQLISLNLLDSSGINVGVVKYPSSSTPVSSVFFTSGTGANLSTDASTTYLVVAKYQWVDGANNDSVTVWVNPGNLGATEDPANKVSTSVGADGTSNAGRFYINRGPSLNLDELRIGQTWAEVTPTGGPVIPRVPYITETLLTPQGIVLRGTNGPGNGVFHVLSSTNVALPTYSWVSLGTNSFDPFGDFDVTNPVPSGLLSHFFRLLVGTQLPPNPTGPSILSGPFNQSVPLNQNANFSVVADGTPPLSYQWYFNTGTPLPGATNDNLIIAAVQTNNAGTYSVTVSNAFGTTSSSNALLIVLLPPVITAGPTNLTVDAGQPALFSVSANGSAPLSYQWYFNTNTPLPNATNATYSIASVSALDAGAYSAVVSNPAGSATSGVAILTANSAPLITDQPDDQNVILGGTALFSVGAVGTGPLSYQWIFNASNLLSGATSSSLSITNVGTNDAGGYTVIITNALGAVTSQVATLTVLQSLPDTAFNLYGFGQAVTGGGLIATNSAGWVKVYTPLDFAFAISNKSGNIKVIEIMNDLDLGWNEVGAAVQAFSIFREHTVPLLHPRLIQTGVSRIDVQQKNGLTIFSATGATIRHASLNIKDSANIIVRNLKFDEMWEWDEISKGDYDRNDWDFITLGDGGGTVSGVWIDHCTFTKSYDGVVDIKGGAYNISFSWNKYTGDDGASNPNSFVWQQINSMESNKTSYAMYNFLRTRGFSTTNIVDIVQGPQKTHLIGATSLNAENAQHAVTFHHQWYINPWDRLPRLRAGNVHNYNIYVDDIQALTAKRLRDAIAATMSGADSNTLNNTYNFKPFLNGSISTEDGAVLVENSVYIDNLTPLRNNQTDPSNPVYTGKIMALDSIYQFHNANMTTTTYRGSSTNAPGDTLFGPVQAPIKPFSWNGFTTLPYSYPLDDPANLESILQSGAGAGLLTWSKTNWLKTSY